MRLLIKASRVFNGFDFIKETELTVENGIIYLGKKAGDYDVVLEADTVLPGFIDTHVHITHDTRPSFFTISLRIFCYCL